MTQNDLEQAQQPQRKSTRITSDSTHVKLNHALITLMQEKGFTQASLAKRVSHDRAYINRVVRNTGPAPIELKLKIAKILGVDSRIIWPDSSDVSQK